MTTNAIVSVYKIYGKTTLYKENGQILIDEITKKIQQKYSKVFINFSGVKKIHAEFFKNSICKMYESIKKHTAIANLSRKIAYSGLSKESTYILFKELDCLLKIIEMDK
ncbi:MAG TPA: DUF4325 domain-containing protein [Chitinophagales bacterium]|nr:DUF4325 domain-containing protein [Chitinophagales bacterium]